MIKKTNQESFSSNELNWHDFTEVSKKRFDNYEDFKNHIDEIVNQQLNEFIPEKFKKSWLIHSYMLENQDYYQDQKYWDYALDKIIELDEDGSILRTIGEFWPLDKVQHRYDEIIKLLSEIDNNGGLLYEVGMFWRGLEIRHYKMVLKKLYSLLEKYNEKLK